MDGQYVVQGLIKRGLSPMQAAVVAGNVEQESSFNPAAWNAKERAGGLIQWRKSRLTNLLKFAQDNHQKPGSIDTQLDFLVHEMTKGSEKGTAASFLKAKTPEEANRALRGYIRYGDNSEGSRFKNSQKWMGSSPVPAVAAPAPGKVRINPAGLGLPADMVADFDETAIDSFMGGESAKKPATAAVKPAAPAQTAPVQKVTPAPLPEAATGLPGWVSGSQDNGADLSDDSIDSFMSNDGAAKTAAAPADNAKELPGNAAPGVVVAKTASQTASAVADMLPAPPENPNPVVNRAGKVDLGETMPSWRKAGFSNPYDPYTQGATLGASDEIVAGMLAPVSAGVNMLTGKGPTGLADAYDQEKAAIDRDKALYEQEHPNKALAGELAGAILTGGGGVKGGIQQIAKAPTMINKLVEGGKTIATGAGLGAFQGYASGEGQEDRASRAKIGAVTGAIAAPVASAALKTGLAVGRKAADMVKAFDLFAPGGTKRTAERILTERLGGADANAFGGEFIPGSKPTMAETSGDPNIAAIQRVMSTNPETMQPFVSRETQQAEARSGFIDALRGSQQELDAHKDALNNAASTAVKGIFQAAKPANASPVVSKIDSILSGAGGNRDAIKVTMTKIRGKLVDENGNLISDDPEYLYQTVRKQIGDMLDGADPDSPAARAAMRELKQVQGSLDDAIESGAPGFKQYLKSYADSAQSIDAMRYMQSLNLLDANGYPTLNKVNNALAQIKKLRASNGTNPAKGLTKQQISHLEDLRNDLLRGSNKNYGIAKGSPTHQNFATDNFLQKALPFGSGKLLANTPAKTTGSVVGGALGYLIGGPMTAAGGAGAGRVIGEIASSVMKRKDAQVEQEIQNLLLNPKAFRPRGGRSNKLPMKNLTRGIVSGVTNAVNNPLLGR